MSDLINRIVVDENICNGKPTIRGLRITVQTILEFLNAGESEEEILKQYPSLTIEDIDACFLWDNLERQKEEGEIDEETKKLLDERMEEFKRNPITSSWEEVKKRIEKRLDGGSLDSD